MSKEFINSIAPGCQASHKKHGVPASVSIAQAILESAWGKSGLTVKANNLFGVKADNSWKGESVLMPTAEYHKGVRIIVKAPFRKYPTLSDSISDHALFLSNNKRYSLAFECKTGCDFAIAIAKAGYATDPKYSAKLISLINKYCLDEYD
jgi:flagellum-specific peptidoglycan hydrolase FlgJ